MDFTGFKTKSIALIANGQEDKARLALEAFGFNPTEIDSFIDEVKVEKLQADLLGDRTSFFKGILDDLNISLPEIDGDTAISLQRLTENWTKMPTIAISLKRTAVTNEQGIEIVTFGWTNLPKFLGAGASTKTASTSTESNGGRKKSVDPPSPYETWQEVCAAILPEAVKAYIDKNGSISGFNARRPVRDAIRAGEITLAGWTPEMDY